MATSVIRLENITKKYGQKVIFRNLSLEVLEGDFLALMGPSGCGKSTILNIIGLIENFDEGDLMVNGFVNIRPNSSKANKLLRNSICYLFQNFALIDDETVEYNLKIAMKYVKGNKQQKRLKMQEALNYVHLQGFEKQYVYELSGGEQQRVAVARIMLKPCSIILADEPTGSLDEENRDMVLDMLKELNKQRKTIVLVTHDKYVAGQCRRIVQL
ncbi:MAG: ABC transporter ATP-binding protein [Eubacteriales bacterium]|nr:ABC transporter ATP-binding protein [Eubacteriales bacterium]